MSAAQCATRTRRRTGVDGSAGHKRDRDDAARRRRPSAIILHARTVGRARRDSPPRAGRRHRPRRIRHRSDRGRRWRGLFQHRNDRLPGNPHRPLLCRPDRHLHLSAYRQYRHQRRRPGEPRRGPRLRRPRRGHRLGRHQPVELALVEPSRRLAEGARHRRHHRDRHAGAHSPHPRPRHAQRRHRQRSGGAVRPRGTEGARRRPRPDGGSRPRSAGHEPRDFRLVADDLGGEERLRQPPDRRGPQGRRHRLRGEAQHPAPARRGRLRRHRRACHHLPPPRSWR